MNLLMQFKVPYVLLPLLPSLSFDPTTVTTKFVFLILSAIHYIKQRITDKSLMCNHK